MPTTTTFSCSHTAVTYSSNPSNPHLPTGTTYPPPKYFSFRCRPCARDKAQLAESNIKANYDPRIEELREMIEKALWSLTRDNPDLKKAIGRKQKEETALMLEKERALIRCWREYKETWE
ncbi:MAG: hypothetical protein ALECFALPRED_000753 [Alectoria fallacina]|uniref:Uncharacterized protein n=1 Tax=Alectoria fallacina TaxID=1903189 RepID=A0A8H3PKM0_9LECA|nr:MAG: hypothetical protein ALECFALPRED_000753 [Alectoria fallacina]